MPINPDASLPTWAKVIKPKSLPASSSSKRKPLSTKEEEAYLRTRCFHILSKQMDHAMDSVLSDCLKPCLKSLEDFLDASAPPPPEPTTDGSSPSLSLSPIRKRRRLDSSSSSPSTSMTLPPFLDGLDISIFDQQQMNSAPNDPLLLPIMVLQGPTFGLDRQEQVNHLVTSLRNARERALVVQVQRRNNQNNHVRGSHGGGGTTGRRSFQWMQELMRQCHQQFPILDTEPLRRRIIKRKKKRAMTFSDMLVLWAQHVNCFDEIVVFLEAEDSLHSAELQDFLHLLAARRAEHGVPLNVVLLGPQEGRRIIELRSSLQGYAGFMIRSLLLPSPQKILEQFWQKLWVEEQFPVMFPPQLLAAIRRSFLYHQKSASRATAKLKQALAYHFTRRGSFLSAANHRAVLRELWQRIAYFFVERRARPMLFGETIDIKGHHHSTETLTQGMEELDTRHRKAQLVLELLELANKTAKRKQKCSQRGLLDPSFVLELRALSCKDMLKVLVKMLQLVNRKDNMSDNMSDSQPPSQGADEQFFFRSQFTKAVKCVSMEEATELAQKYEVQQINRQRDLLNELIILVGNGRDGDDLSEIEETLDGIIADWVFNQADNYVESITQKLTYRNRWASSSLPLEYDWEETTESLASEPRRQTVAALLTVAQTANDQRGSDYSHLSVANVAGTMYHLLHDRVAATQEDWYEEFWQKAILQTASSYSREESFTLFSLGLRYLKQCGLIAEKLRVGSRSDIIYERAKLVWCNSGD